MKRLLIVVACLLAAACTTTDTRTALSVTPPPPGATILLVKPDIELSLLTAAGLSEPRADWTEQAVTNVENALELSVASSSHTFRLVDPADAMQGRSGQLLRLHEAVGNSILVFEYGLLPLPTHQAGFNWTLGEGAQSLAEQYGADYALFTFGRGNYASSARVATFVVMSALGVGIPLGNQQVFTSLVDLRTGRVVWFNVGLAGPSADMRNPQGARSLVDSMMKGAPL
jgi:hypothetical protein